MAESSFSWGRILGVVSASAVLWGGADAGRILLGERLLLTQSEVALLVAASILGVLPMALVLGLPVLAVASRLSRPGLASFLSALFTPTVAVLAVWWFTDPPPFQAPFPLQGNVVAFAGLTVALAGLGAGLYRLGPLPGVLIPVLGLGIRMVWGHDAPAAASEPLPVGAPNILLVTMDTSRADRFGAYGNAKVDTRNFDTIAKEGALFLNASAVAAVTGPSHTSMLSGAGPWDHGVLLNGVPLPADRPLISEILHQHGYATGAFVSAYVLDGSLGFAHGFDVYDDDFGFLRGGQGLLLNQIWAMAQRAADPDDVLERRGGDTTDLALAWMSQQKGNWFAWVHLFDAHGPYTPPPPFDTRYYQGDPHDPGNTSMKDVKDVAPYLKKSLEGVTDLDYVLSQYDGEISYVDSQLGRLLASIDTTNTLVVVIADHGESLGEHGVWFNHGDDVYETSVHVPFALRWPGRVEAPTRISIPFEGTDLAPTVLDLVGIAPPASMTGNSLAPFLANRPQTADPRAMARSMCFDRQANLTERQAGHITAPKYRMVGLRGPSSRYTQRELDGSASYFDLSADPLGLEDVYATTSQSTEGSQLMGLLRDQATRLMGGDATSRSAIELSEEERARLEALGYLEQ